ncbi:hypothetical protein LCGC14_1491370 [marine sediment metagenome]|uniref:Uncharacterized protein n=1 Tax=marine sediment metagenome TaxID=412755 RepID=A0A0F9LM74_9ZZZZ
MITYLKAIMKCTSHKVEYRSKTELTHIYEFRKWGGKWPTLEMKIMGLGDENYKAGSNYNLTIESIPDEEEE